MASSRKRALNILIVEDDEGAIRLMEEAFRETGQTTRLHISRNGKEAWNLLQKHVYNGKEHIPDLILLDIHLPLESGFTVLAQIKSHPHLKRIPVLVLSSSSRREDIQKSYDLHASCYLRKPVNLEPFIELVRSIENFWSRMAVPPD